MSGPWGKPTVGGPATQLTETSGPTDLDIEAIADGEYFRRSGTTVVGDTPTGGGTISYGNTIPTGGSAGDIYYQLGVDLYWKNVAGTWTRQWSSTTSLQLGPSAQPSVGIAARYNSGTLNVFGGGNATSAGTPSGVAYATTNVMTTRNRVEMQPLTTANTASSGNGSAVFGPVVVDSGSLAGKCVYIADFGLTALTDANFRFFSGFVTNLTLSSNPTTASSHSSGNRIGLAIDANTAFAAKWLVNHTNSNLQNASAATLVADRWYRHIIYNRGGTIYQELWEWTSAASDPTLAASTTHTPAATTWANMRIQCTVANAGTAASAGTMHFGQLWGIVSL